MTLTPVDSKRALAAMVAAPVVPLAYLLEVYPSLGVREVGSLLVLWVVAFLAGYVFLYLIEWWLLLRFGVVR